MPKKSTKITPAAFQEALRKAAMGYPDAQEEVACKGTAVESAVFRSKKKSFLFLNEKEIRLKLRDSQTEASKQPHTTVGLGGWTTLKLDPANLPSVAMLERWIDESFRAGADPKQLAVLDKK